MFFEESEKKIEKVKHSVIIVPLANGYTVESRDSGYSVKETIASHGASNLIVDVARRVFGDEEFLKNHLNIIQGILYSIQDLQYVKEQAEKKAKEEAEKSATEQSA